MSTYIRTRPPFKYTDPSGEQLRYNYGNDHGPSDEFAHSGKYAAVISPNACESTLEKVLKIFGQTILIHGNASDVEGQLGEFLLSNEMKTKYSEMMGIALSSEDYEAFILGAIIPKYNMYGQLVSYGVKFTSVTLAKSESHHVTNEDIRSALEGSGISSEDVYLFLHTHESGSSFSTKDFEFISLNTFNDSYADKIDLFRNGSVFGVVTSSFIEVLVVNDMRKYQDWQSETLGNNMKGLFLKGNYIDYLKKQNNSNTGVGYYKFKWGK